MTIYTEDDERVIYVPFDEADRIKTARVLTDMWFVVHPHRGIVFVNAQCTGGLRFALPTCSRREDLAHEVCRNHFAPWGRVRKIPLLYLHDQPLRITYPQRKP